jgi:DNA (cytosine-5)-methyltransferase 1
VSASRVTSGNRKNRVTDFGASIPRSLDLFAGIGGLTLGLHSAGIDCIGGIDCWPEAARTFEHNLSPLRCMISDLTKTSVTDIEEFFGISVGEIDIISGGPPCQGFSTVGKREFDDPRNELWGHYRDLVAAIRPAYVIIENVEGMLVMKGGRVRDAVIEGFGEIGYRMKCSLLRAADFGVPQLRKRTIFLGWLDGLQEPQFPVPYRAKPVTVAEAIFDLPPLESGKAATDYLQAPLSEYQKSRRKDCNVLSNHEAANHPPELVEVLSYIPDGGNRKSIPDHLQPRSGFHNSYARLASFKPAIAVTSNMRKPSSARATHPLQSRGLTVREGLRLQSFDDDYVVLGSRTSQYLQVGNAVPPLLGRAIGTAVKTAYARNSSELVHYVRSLPGKPVGITATESLDLFESAEVAG